MISRRSFIISAIAAAAGFLLLGKCAQRRLKAGTPMRAGRPARGLVVWYSQTGNTARVGRLIAATWERAGVRVVSGDYRTIDPATIGSFDIVAAGSPVYYYEVPENFRRWLGSLPHIEGKPVASFVTFGGEGGNQHNTAFQILDILSGRGGAPAGMATFGNMSTFAPTWSTGNTERILRYRHLPDEHTFRAVRAYAAGVLRQAESGRGIQTSSSFSFRNWISGGVSIALTKLLITGHRIEQGECVGCGTCTRSCPIGAINHETFTVDTGRCIACLGCINNCPVSAVKMRFMGSDVYGFREFVSRNSVTIREPEELSGG